MSLEKDQEGREIVWKGLSFNSLEYSNMSRIESGWEFSGEIVAIIDRVSFGVRYDVQTDSGFNTERAKIELLSRDGKRQLGISRSENSWFVDGKKIQELEGCTDIDIEATPVTNTIPIRRAKLRVGEIAEFSAAWIRVPSMTLTRLEQSYERISTNKYIYKSVNFSTEIYVDSNGIVTTYGGVWEEVRAESQ